MGKNGRTVLALLAASAAAPIPLMSTLVYSGSYITAQNILPAFFMWILFSLVALLNAVVLGLPIYSTLKSYNMVRWWSAMIAGFIVGIIYPLWGIYPLASRIIFSVYCLFGICGAVGACVMWVILRDRNSVTVSTTSP
jgi:hypothetical protein